MAVEIRAFIREANHNKISEHVFELHTLVLELGLRGATHALRVLSSNLIACDFRQLRAILLQKQG